MQFYDRLKSDLNILKELLRKLLEALDLLQHRRIIHADLKPDNVLVEFDGSKIVSLKLIDFGSAFFYDQPCNMRMTTPEYQAPECLEYSRTTSGYGIPFSSARIDQICANGCSRGASMCLAWVRSSSRS